MGRLLLRTTLVFLLKKCKILLGYKKKGFGQGNWNGFGGKITKGETVTEAACRELEEECGIRVKELDLQPVSLLQFEFEGEDLFIEVNVFKTEIFDGEEQESDEMRPKWFNVSDIPFDKMWPDDRIWFPYMFDNKPFWAKFKFQGRSTILDYELKEMAISSFEGLKYADI